MELAAGTPGTTTLTFTATSTDAQKCAYTVIEAGKTMLTAQEILQGGEFAPNQSVTLTADGLNPETAYLILAAARNGDLYSPVTQLAMTTAKGDDPEPDPYTRLTDINPMYGRYERGCQFHHCIRNRSGRKRRLFRLWMRIFPRT